MKKENILTYRDVETILTALAQRAMDERERAEKAENDGENDTAGTTINRRQSVAG